VTQGGHHRALLLAALATIVARDAAENAVSVGGQIGGQRGARTVRAELAHVGAASVGAGAVVVVLGVARLDIDGLPFGALVALIVGSVVLVLGSNR